jgi:hypothetical protein
MSTLNLELSHCSALEICESFDDFTSVLINSIATQKSTKVRHIPRQQKTHFFSLKPVSIEFSSSWSVFFFFSSWVIGFP